MDYRKRELERVAETRRSRTMTTDDDMTRALEKGSDALSYDDHHGDTRPDLSRELLREALAQLLAVLDP